LPNLEEYDFLNQICLTELSANKHVNFAAVVDNVGKLIVARSRRKPIQTYLKVNSKTNAEAYCRNQPSHRFYKDSLLPVLKKMQSTCHNHEDIKDNNTRSRRREILFDVLELNRNNNSVKIVITPLTEGKDKYLCVYFESSATSYQDIVMKINSMI
jgi:hypothetical protein